MYFNERTVATKWRRANGVPVNKIDEREVDLKHRAVPLTSVAVLENITRKQIVFLNSTSYLSGKQHSFKVRRSCMTNLWVCMRLHNILGEKK